MVGKGVLLECLDDERVQEVLVINRRTLNMNHPKLKEVIQKDFGDFSHLQEDLAEYDACYMCMGVSAAGLKEADYYRITHDYTLSLASACHAANPNMTITYVSGDGTDSSEKGRMMWARVKGKTENDLLKLGFKQAFMFRPGIIKPLRGIKSATKLYQFFYTWFSWLLPIFKAMSKHSMTDTTKLGRAMINLHFTGNSDTILRNKEINEIGSE